MFRVRNIHANGGIKTCFNKHSKMIDNIDPTVIRSIWQGCNPNQKSLLVPSLLGFRPLLKGLKFENAFILPNTDISSSSVTELQLSSIFTPAKFSLPSMLDTLVIKNSYLGKECILPPTVSKLVLETAKRYTKALVYPVTSSTKIRETNASVKKTYAKEENTKTNLTEWLATHPQLEIKQTYYKGNLNNLSLKTATRNVSYLSNNVKNSIKELYFTDMAYVEPLPRNTNYLVFEGSPYELPYNYIRDMALLPFLQKVVILDPSSPTIDYAAIQSIYGFFIKRGISVTIKTMYFTIRTD